MNPQTQPGGATDRLTGQWQDLMMFNYGTPAIFLAHGKGATVWDVEGNSYLDLLAGIATSSLGHAHPAIVAAAAEQAQQLVHTSNLYGNQPSLKLARRLLDLTGQDGRIFFCQDGATANEAAYKLARKHGRKLEPGGSRLEIVAATGSFHGRTMGALSVTGSQAKRDPFEPLPGPVSFVAYGDEEALSAAVTERTAAVFLEPVLGEGGIVVPPEGYLGAARRICDRSGALLVVDEVQSGMGRTGGWFASLNAGVVPDVLTLAKGLAGGFPLGACIGFGAAGELFAPGDHGSTFGGNPVSCAVALAVIDTIESEQILDNVTAVGDHWRERFEQVQHDLLLGTRGVGLWRALLLAQPAARSFETVARQAGFLVNAVAPDVIRLAPPLNLTLAQADQFADALTDLLDRTRELEVSDAR
ncbi:MAG: acetylornithine transaminase [Candidatus Nanopelagicales bacterium]